LARSILYILFGEESLRAQSVRVGGRPGLVSERPPLRESPHGKRTLFATLPAMTAVSMCSWRILIIKPRLGDEPGRSAVGGGRLSSYWKFTNLPRRLTPQTVDATLRWLAPLLFYLVGNFPNGPLEGTNAAGRRQNSTPGSIDHDGEETVESVRCRRCGGTRLHSSKCVEQDSRKFICKILNSPAPRLSDFLMFGLLFGIVLELR
jgi:hypothetical protein